MTFTFIVLLISSLQAIAQTPGGYQSAASGNWNAASTWLRHNGISFVAAVVAPSSSNGVITILNGHTILNSNKITIDQTIVAGATLSHTLEILIIENGIGVDITVNRNFIYSGAILFLLLLLISENVVQRLQSLFNRHRNFL